jgi:hypothetical protein
MFVCVYVCACARACRCLISHIKPLGWSTNKTGMSNRQWIPYFQKGCCLFQLGYLTHSSWDAGRQAANQDIHHVYKTHIGLDWPYLQTYESSLHPERPLPLNPILTLFFHQCIVSQTRPLSFTLFGLKFCFLLSSSRCVLHAPLMPLGLITLRNNNRRRVKTLSSLLCNFSTLSINSLSLSVSTLLSLYHMYPSLVKHSIQIFIVQTNKCTTYIYVNLRYAKYC